MASRRIVWFSALLALLLMISLLGGSNPPASIYCVEAPEYWPTAGWLSTSPEAQGMSTAQLQAMEEYIQQLAWGPLIRSVLIIRNGYIVWESYYDPAYGPNQQINIFSCTKSVTASLLGMAIGEGHIVGVNETVVDFFTDRTIANLTAEKEAITLEQVLTMTTGLAWDEWPYGPTSSFTYMIDSPDWVQYVLDQPMRYAPGVVWDYNSGGSHLLSMIINQSVGTTTLDYAESHLFTPLGITDYQWDTDPQGVVFGGANLHLTPRDMAKFGFLYLNNGTWNGEQLVPVSWITESTAHHATPYNDTDTIGYGYHWWLNLPINTYVAIGYNGQQINIVPEHNLVVVFTAWYEDASYSSIMEDYIIPAIGYQPPALPRFLLTFEQITIIAIVLMGVGVAIPLCVELFYQVRARRRSAHSELDETRTQEYEKKSKRA
jgi:CubicO group peptidase (beta-lactamase class C family)